MDTASLSSVDKFVKYIDGATSNPTYDRYFLYNELQEQLTSGGVSSEVLWRLTRAALDLSSSSKANGDENSKIKFIIEALDWGKQAVNLDDEDPNCHQWYAAALDLYICEICKNHKEIEQKAAEFLKHMNIAIQMKPNDAYLHHVYGTWFYKWAQTNWFQRFICFILNRKLPKGSFDDAIKELSIAHQINMGWKTNAFYLAKSLIAVKRFSDAINVIKTSLKESNQQPLEMNLTTETAMAHELELLYDKYAKYDREDSKLFTTVNQ